MKIISRLWLSPLTRNTVDLGTLNVQQISQLKKQLDEELEQLTTSFSHLNAAQTKFQECLKLVQAEPSTPTNGKASPQLRDAHTLGLTTILGILVPLTNSLYVRGRLSDSNRVLVDIGTGFYIEKAWLQPLRISYFFVTNRDRHWTLQFISTKPKSATWAAIWETSKTLSRENLQHCAWWKKVSTLK